MRSSSGLMAVAMACVVVGAGCTRNWDDYLSPPGEPCTDDSECRSGLCAEDAAGERVCADRCEVAGDCVPGWSCASGGICECAPSSETCNATDDDCDGLVDEEGACGCSGAETCNGVDDDCNGAIDEGGVCGCGGTGAEVCNGVDDDCDGVIDEPSAALCPAGRDCVAGTCRCDPREPSGAVDLLLMIDNSNSMGEEQASLAAELPRLIEILATGDRDRDGTPDFVPARSLHVGIVSSDMGVGGHDVPTCDRGTFGARLGDDGILLSRSRAVGCDEMHPQVFEFAAGDDPLELAFQVSCATTLGTAGCGFEQQLESVLKAVSPSARTAYTIPDYSPPLFFRSTLGHADGANAGFLRDDSVLAILMATDEEDCSAANPDVFNPSSAAFGATDLSLRCFTYPNTSHPVERYVAGTEGRNGLLGVRRRPDQLVFGLIAGVPVELETRDFETILDAPAMQETIDPAMPTRLTPSCNVPGRGIALPPRRLVQVAQGLELAGARSIVGSICQDSFAGTVDRFVVGIADSLSPAACE